MSTTTCPHCNAIVTLPQETRAEQSIVCPRCEELFKVLQDHLADAPKTSWTSDAIQETASPRVVLTESQTAFPARRMKTRTVGALVLLGMFVMAGAGLALALATQQKRREHDAGIPSRFKRPRQIDEVEPGPARTRPLDFEALRYLPAGTDVVLA